MKHAFSNFIKIAISKLLAYVVSTFCKKCIAKYTHARVCEEVGNNLLSISQMSYESGLILKRVIEEVNNDESSN